MTIEPKTKMVVLTKEQWTFILETLKLTVEPFLEESDTMELETIKSLGEQIND